MPALVGWIISGVLWLFRNRIGFMLMSILAWLGIAFVTNKVIVGPVIGEIKDYVAGMSAEGNFGVMALAYLRYLKFDQALTMVFSAYAARVAMAATKLHLAKRGG